MGVTVSSGNNYTRASVFATSDAVTMMCWFFPTSLPSAGNYYNMLASGPFAAGGPNGVAMQCHASLFSIGTWDNDYDGSTLSTNTWYHGAMTRNGNAKAAFLNGVSDASGSNADILGTSFAVGHSGDGTTPFLGRLAAVKLWSAVLTAAEIVQERNQILPARLANLLGFWPLLTTGDDEIDFSGAGRTLTVNGTPTTGDGPPVPWKSGRQRFVYVPATVTPGFMPRLPVMVNQSVTRAATW